MATAPKLKDVSETQLIETSQVTFIGLNAEYTGMEELSIGQPFKATITGYIRKEGIEMLEQGDGEKEPSTRPYIQVKVTGMKRTKL